MSGAAQEYQRQFLIKRCKQDGVLKDFNLDSANIETINALLNEKNRNTHQTLPVLIAKSLTQRGLRIMDESFFHGKMKKYLNYDNIKIRIEDDELYCLQNKSSSTYNPGIVVITLKTIILSLISEQLVNINEMVTTNNLDVESNNAEKIIINEDVEIIKMPSPPRTFNSGNLNQIRQSNTNNIINSRRSSRASSFDSNRNSKIHIISNELVNEETLKSIDEQNEINETELMMEDEEEKEISEQSDNDEDNNEYENNNDDEDDDDENDDDNDNNDEIEKMKKTEEKIQEGTNINNYLVKVDDKTISFDINKNKLIENNNSVSIQSPTINDNINLDNFMELIQPNIENQKKRELSTQITKKSTYEDNYIESFMD